MGAVHFATGLGIGVGIVIGAISLGWTSATPQTQLAAQSGQWWVVVVTTILPVASYVKGELILKGPIGGFVTGLGMGLGFFLLLAGKVT